MVNALLFAGNEEVVFTVPLLSYEVDGCWVEGGGLSTLRWSASSGDKILIEA